MHMGNSAQEVLTSYPIPVHFAGWDSTTSRLQQSGWDLSLQQDYARASCRLALRLERAGIFAMTNPMDYMAMELFYCIQKGNLEPLKAMGFDVCYIGSRLEFQRIPVMGNAFLGDFQPIDATPQMTIIERMEDFSLFKRLDKTKDVLIDPNDVPGLMEMILKAQKPEQEMIKARAKSRAHMQKWREDQNCRYNPTLDFQPAMDIKAQIISLSA